MCSSICSINYVTVEIIYIYKYIIQEVTSFFMKSNSFSSESIETFKRALLLMDIKPTYHSQKLVVEVSYR